MRNVGCRSAQAIKPSGEPFSASCPEFPSPPGCITRVFPQCREQCTNRCRWMAVQQIGAFWFPCLFTSALFLLNGAMLHISSILSRLHFTSIHAQLVISSSSLGHFQRGHPCLPQISISELYWPHSSSTARLDGVLLPLPALVEG
jgi:hypothetical protein